MTFAAAARQQDSKGLGARNKRLLLVLISVLLVIAVSIFIFGRFVNSPPALQPKDVLLLAPESIVRVEAAAKSGDIVAQTILGSAYLSGKADVPRNVNQAVYWLRRVADRNPSEYYRICNRMQWLLDKTRQESDPRKRVKLEIEYLEAAAKKLAFEASIIGLIDVFLGRHGYLHENPALAVRYMRLGSAYGLPAAQRTLGIVTEFGLFGVPEDNAAGMMLLTEAARNGDQIAQKVLLEKRAFDHALLHAKVDSEFSLFW